MFQKIKKVSAPVRIDFAGGTTDIKAFESEYGGAVLNTSIDKYVRGSLNTNDKGIKLEYEADTPTSSGLGTSGAMTLVWAALINKTKNKKELAEQVYKISEARGLGESDGKQDQYAAAYGGINLWEFKKGCVKRRKVNLSKKMLKKLESRLILVYLGEHFSGDQNKSMIDNLKKKKNIDELKRIKEIAYEMKKSLEKEDLEMFAELMNEETKHREKLAKGIVTKDTKKIMKLGFENGAVAAKICGSGGKGCVLFLGDKPKIKKFFGKKCIEFKFDFEGLKWE